MGKPPKARELYDALRVLEAKAKEAYEKQRGRKYSRREAARKAGGPESTLDRRLAEWLPEEWAEARTPGPGSAEDLLAVVRLWSEWAAKPCNESWWRTLLDEAQPPRFPTRRADSASVGTADTESGRFDHLFLQEQVAYLQGQVGELRAGVRTLQDHVLGTEDTVPRLLERLDEANAEVAAARTQLAAAAEYAKESDALLEQQQEQLGQLRAEIKTLRRQVQQLTEENRDKAPSKSAAYAAHAAHSAQTGAANVQSPVSTPLWNAEARWDDFDPREYVSRNYGEMAPEDKEILSLMRDHFSGHFRERPGRVPSAIDVGAGANLYPALAMLPWSDRITLLERSSRNLEYLNGQLPGYDRNWDPFWDLLCEDRAYAHLGVDPRERFRQAVQVEQGNLFDLGDRPGRWDLGTMFFVAESMTTSLEEFRHGVSCFLRALRPGAPFAAAFMEHSAGYRVGDVDFPACDVGVADIQMVIAAFARETRIYRLNEAGISLRDGYSGMILACGRRGE
ncbi:SCO2525 family SAM-dependent methyltransferase [Streptomyces sp. T028]|uniref:SCO2525 family SAM-dependent methyltransferase n=1 Tax=Streptomyces sp. T028 TaxID=3394379 RepID=UPI003A8576CE